MEQFQIESRSRHLRYIFFVDENYPYEKLFNLIRTNQKMWGGRYNPIIPVKYNVISEGWQSVLKFYDPDYIFYTQEIDPEIIKQMRFTEPAEGAFNPCGHCNLDEQPRRQDILGVDSFYFLSEFHPKSKIILTNETWKLDSPLISFYKMNFGLETSLFNNEFELTKDFDRKIVGEDEFLSLNKFIYELKPINQSHLSRRSLNTVILRGNGYNEHYQFEIVIAKDKSSIADLLYYWNRMLFKIYDVLYLTVEELNILCGDEDFGKVLSRMYGGNEILVVSQSLTTSEIQLIISTTLKQLNIHKAFVAGKVEKFPFEVLDAKGSLENNFEEKYTVQTIHSKKGLFHLPKLSFTNKVSFYAQQWAVDIQIKKLGEGYQNEIMLPFTTDTHQIVTGVKGRINRRRRISIFIHNQLNTSSTLELNIPEFRNLLPQLISRPMIHGERTENKYYEIGLHDDSNKLSSFLKTFNYDFATINDFFTDKFWVDIFFELAENRNSNAIGNTISCKQILRKGINALAGKGIFQLDEKKNVIRGENDKYINEKSLTLGLKKTISELCNYRVFLKGFNLKCSVCSSQFWYSLTEVGEKITCKGCLESFVFPVEPEFNYKLNDLIKNNIIQPNDSNDGNLAVIRTLVSIHNRSNQSFKYSPQINLYVYNEEQHKIGISGDIDVAALSDGMFIIGEVKHTSSAFAKHNYQTLKSLAEVAKAIRPDKIILSCYEDKDNKLENATKELHRIFNEWVYKPEIEPRLLYTPNYFHLGNHRYFYH